MSDAKTQSSSPTSVFLCLLGALVVGAIPGGISAMSLCTNDGAFVVVHDHLRIRSLPLVETLVISAGLVSFLRIYTSHGFRVYVAWTMFFMLSVLALLRIFHHCDLARTDPLHMSTAATVVMDYTASIMIGGSVRWMQRLIRRRAH
jgi:hypothetical protein